MVSLKDALSASLRGDLVQSSIRRGDVYRMKLTKDEGITPKNKGDKDRNKYFVIIGKDAAGNAIGFVVINSEINAKIPTILKPYEYLISAQQYDFLEGEDRYVHCSELKEIKKERFADLFDIDKNKGTIGDEDLKHIIDLLKRSPKVTPKQLKRFDIK